MATIKLLMANTSLIADLCNIVETYTQYLWTEPAMIPLNSGRFINMTSNSPAYLVGDATCCLTSVAFNGDIDPVTDFGCEALALTCSRDINITQISSTICASAASGTLVVDLLTCSATDPHAMFVSVAHIAFPTDLTLNRLHSSPTGLIDVRIPQGDKVLVRVTGGSAKNYFFGHATVAILCEICWDDDAAALAGG